MAAPPKPWKVEYAKSARSSCKTCKSAINKEKLRLGKMVQATQFDGFMPMWHHAECIFKKPNQIKSVDDVEGLESLRWEDQQTIRKYVEVGPSNKNSAESVKMEYGIEVSQTARATCKHCGQKITKGEVRVFTKPDSHGAKNLSWRHAKCFVDISPSTELEGLPGWGSIPDTDQMGLLRLTKKALSTATDGAKSLEVSEQVEQSTTKRGSTRKKNISKTQESAGSAVEGSKDITPSIKSGSSASEHLNSSDLEKEVEIQTKKLWDLKDELKKHVTVSEMREMLDINGQNSTGSELDLRDKCADGMMFGALGKCPLCSGHLCFTGGLYRCHGYLSAWSKCSYSTREPERIKRKWKIPEETNNQFLVKWFKSQKLVKPKRILRSPSCNNLPTAQTSHSSQTENLGVLKVSMSGLSQESVEKWKKKIETVGGEVHPKIKKGTSCLVVGLSDKQDAEVKKAKRMKIPIVREEYLVECFKTQKQLPVDLYKVEPMGESSMVKVKVKGSSAVNEASGLQDSGHILEDRNSIYNTTLNMSDLSTGINSYYIIQIIEEDKGSDCYVFRKWGRVGNDKIGGKKLEEMPKSDAIAQFKRLFLEKTGNTWEAWQQKKDFQKQPGKFFPLEIDYGVNKQPAKRQRIDKNSQLPPPVLELMMMLFNVEAYRSAMMEFEINMSEMPLGKLSKHNIQKGFEALTEIQDLLSHDHHPPPIKESLLVDASNRFFTMIPSIHPHIIRDEADFKAKVKMLEALQDIEIASRLVGFDVDSGESLDDKYKKLHCDITPLPHDDEDYRMIEKYLHTTHAPTHTDWTLELEEVFALEREGEFDRFAPQREKLGNRMLLWHGSRLTNFVGILSEGLRIAPPEAPATGYMFGKGIYFADLVSKSAQYCFTDKKNPVGLMLLSEVALGEVYELTKATYMEKPPRGKHSTKGLGKKVPEESSFAKWRDDVTVPCGKPVSSRVKASELMYNEYIVYNTAQSQVDFQFGRN